MFTFGDILHETKQKRKQTLKSAQFGLDIIFKLTSNVIAHPRGGTWVHFCWVCAAALSEPLPHYSVFRGQLYTPS